jgi:hypothetical protein
MGGAFVAVANDASAVHWNPAGLVVGDLVGVTIGWDGFQFRNPSAPPVPGPGRDTGTLISAGTWPLGLSYGRYETASFEEGSDGHLTVRGLRTHQLGVTLVQTIVERLTIGSTLKFLHGTATSGTTSPGSTGDWLAGVLDQEGDSDNAFDLDIGVLADFGRLRAGLTLKNLLQPDFGHSAETATSLTRRARLGLAVFPVDGLTLAIDVDLDTADPSVGLREMVAIGGETRVGLRAYVRGGIRWRRDSHQRPIVTAGGGFQLAHRIWLDGHAAYGWIDEDRGFGIAIRAGY